MSHRKQIVDLMVVVILVVVVAGVVHIWTVDRTAVARWRYPVEAFFTHFTVSCDEQSPPWLKQLITASVKQVALANQLAYITPSGTTYACQSGWNNGFLRGGRVDSAARFRYASTTKIATADLILRLIEEHKLRRDATIGELFPEEQHFQDARVPSITVGQLLNHTAGFDRIASGDPMFMFNQKPWCPYTIEPLSKLTLGFSPGEKQVYANLSYCLLGVIAERIEGRPYRTLVDERYSLDQRGIVFLDGPLLADEVRPDFRNDSFYTDTYHTYYDFPAISSSAGLSGSATALASLVRDIIAPKTSRLLAPSDYRGCDLSQLRGCYGHAFYHYQPTPDDMTVYIQEGYLHGSSSVVMVDDKGGVLVLLSAGKAPRGFSDNQHVYQKMHRMLSDFYERKMSN